MSDKKAKEKFLYNTRYYFVKPILDENTEKGIKYLIKNPPVDYLYNLKQYQQKAIEEVKKRTKKVTKIT